MLKLSKTAIRELSKMYRAVLIGALLVSVFTATGAMASDTVSVLTGVGSTTINNVAVSTSGSSITGTTSITGLTGTNTSTDVYTTTAVDTKVNNVDKKFTNHTVNANFVSISTSNGDSSSPTYGTAKLGDTTVNGKLEAGATTVSNLDSGGTITVGGVGSNPNISLNADGSIQAGRTVPVSGAAPDYGFTVDSSGNITKAGTIQAKAIDTATTNKVKLGADGYTTEITGNETVSGTLGVTGETTLGNKLTVSTGGAAITGNTVVNGTFKSGATTVSSITTSNGAATPSYGTATLGTTDIHGNETVSGTLKVGSANAISGTTSTLNMGNNALTGVKGITLTDGASTPKTATLSIGGTNIISTNNASLDAGTGSVSATTYKAGSNTQLSNNSLLLSNGTHSSTLSATADGLNVNTGLKVNGNESVTGTLGVTGKTTLGDTLTVSGGGANITGLVTANNGVKVAGGSLTFGTSTNNVNAIDNGGAPKDSTSTGNATTMATVATVLTSAENAVYTGDKVNITAGTISGAIQDLDDKIGTVGTSINNVANSKTVGQNIDALNTAMGSVGQVKTAAAVARGNVTNGSSVAPADLSTAVANIDATLGKIHNLYDGTTVNTTGVPSTVHGNSNLAVGTATTAEDHLVSLDNSIGDRTVKSENGAINAGMAVSLSEGLRAAGNQIGSLNYTSTHYVREGSSITDAISTLDMNLDRVENKVKKMDKQMKSGFASMAAVAGLKPNARACNDTQIAIGGGYYRGTAGIALGGFHYVNDNLLLNLGAGYAGNQSTTISGGLTFGW